MVELDTFITEALASIARGIQGVHELADVGKYIAPLIQGENRNDAGVFHLKSDDKNQATIVGFDVQVTTEYQKEGGGKAGGKARLFVVDVELGADGKLTSKSTQAHRLKFAIPLQIPLKTAPPLQRADSRALQRTDRAARSLRSVTRSNPDSFAYVGRWAEGRRNQAGRCTTFGRLPDFQAIFPLGVARLSQLPVGLFLDRKRTQKKFKRRLVPPARVDKIWTV